MPTSSEFISLCRAQVALLTQGLGAALSVVYLTERLIEEPTAGDKLIPVVAYPETAGMWEGSLKAGAILPATKDRSQPRLTKILSQKAFTPELLPNRENGTPHSSNHSLTPSQQIVLPLMHEGVLMGLLVTSREDRAWNEQERREIERVAQTLTFARLLDQQRDWLEQKLSQQRQLQAKQRDLLDNLLHQFRNPLTALRTFGKLLIKRLLPGDANRAVADNILRESERLTQLLQQFDQVIDLTVEDLEPINSQPNVPTVMEATVESVSPPLSLLPSASTELFALTDVLKPLLASAGAIAAERHLDLFADIPSNLPPIRANAKELTEVLSNLIDNALKYTPAGGKIYIQAGLEQDNLQGVAISDTGLGIPPQDLEHLFERHYRGVKADSEIPGTGLGLAIAKDLIEQMQGKIEVYSPAIWHPDSASGVGTTFIVWLSRG